jgi:polysaccharide biosynthesis/export protein
MKFKFRTDGTVFLSIPSSYSTALKSLAVLSFVLVLFMSLAVSLKVTAQQNTVTTTVSQITPINPITDDTRYRIGPGDVLDVRVVKAPELSRESVRVDQRGIIHLPMLEGDIKAACLTETELAQQVADLYREYKRNPSVDVFVKEYQSQPVAVIGAVNNFQPEGTQFRLHRRVKLLEMLTLAGGPSEKAGLSVNIVHAGGPGPCEESTNSPAESDLASLVSYRLADTLKGVPAANPFLRPGDIVVVPEGNQVYVVGNVLKPSTIPLREELTVTRAIAIAGGTAPSTKKDRVRIVRQIPGSVGKQEIFVDLTAIDKQRALDLVLMPNDIVDVPISGSKSFLRTLLGTVAPAVSQASVRVVP